MENKAVFVVIFCMMLLLWSLLSGVSADELIAGSFASMITAVFSYKLFSLDKKHYHKKFIWLLVYIPYYMYREIMAHADTIYRILTGRIKPSIVEIGHVMRSDFGTTALANAITLTPGTLTLELKDQGFYVHWLNTRLDRKGIAESFQRRLKRIWD